jgi:hypothetical protein
MSGLAIHLPFYATGLQADNLAAALEELTPKLLRLEGVLEVRVYRSKDDAYKFQQVIHITSKKQWEAIWNSRAFIDFRTVSTKLFQKPLAYVLHETLSQGRTAGLEDLFADDPFAKPVQGEASASSPVAAGSPGL